METEDSVGERSPHSEHEAGGSGDDSRVFIPVPVFMDRAYRMVNHVPDDIVCWSEGGDSFIIKQVAEFERLLPSYYNHQKFLSFVRQLNFYGFRRTKLKPPPSSRPSTDGGARGGAATAQESESWEEFSHPQFRRGRRDLLVGIKRHKAGGRSKRKGADTSEMDTLSALRADVGELSGSLREVSGKLDEIFSLLLGGNGAGERLPRLYAPPPVPRKGGINNSDASAGGGGEGFCNVVGAGAADVDGRGSGGRWLGRWGDDRGEGRGGGGDDSGRAGVDDDPCKYGALPGFYMGSCPPMVHEQQHRRPRRGWNAYPLYSPPRHQPSSADEDYPPTPFQAQHRAVRPRPSPSPVAEAAAAAARASANKAVDRSNNGYTRYTPHQPQRVPNDAYLFERRHG